ncbi:hypothetical protein SSTU70S_03793 [Stutzerimonas stutzeri]
MRDADTADDLALSKAVARYYFKLLAYKDEYEVARLYSEPEFRQQLAGSSRATTSCSSISPRPGWPSVTP